MSLFTGTELVIGAVLSAWLLWVGMGGIVGGRIVRRFHLVRCTDFMRLSVSTAALCPVTVVVIRLGRGWLSRPPGSFPAVSEALLFALLVMAPFGLLYGALYNIASEIWARGLRDLRASVSRVYIWEAVGTLAGALLFSFVLLRIVSQFEAAVAVAFFVIAVVVIGMGTKRFLGARVVGLILLGSALVLAAPRIDSLTIRAVFPGYRVERHLSSKYGEIVAASKEEVLTFFSGGGRLFSIPEPERVEETVHIPLLLHPAPKDVLFIGGSMGGGWQEALKHPTVRRIDCLELDGDLLSLALELSGTWKAGDGAPGGAKRDPEYVVDFIEGDGRFFLSRGEHHYDVIILSAPPPVNLQWNRYYTLQFFDLARESLSDGGLFALQHPSSENFLSGPQLRVLKSLESTVERAFAESLVLPGSTCHFIGSDRPLELDSLVVRLSERNIETRFVSEAFLPYRFSEGRLSSLRSSLIGAGAGRVNTDGRPTLPLYELLLEGSRLGSAVMGRFGWFVAHPPALPLGVLALVLLLVFVCARRGSAARLAVSAVGMCSLVLQLIVLLSYQTYTGLLYYAIALLTALFMAGAALGASLSMRKSVIGERDLLLVHGGFVVCALLLLGWYHLAGRALLPSEITSACLYLCSCAGGILTGAYYPLVVRTALPGDGAPPALFYAWDLFGACVGGILGAVILFPLAGMAGTVAFLVFVHVAAALLLVGKW